MAMVNVSDFAELVRALAEIASQTADANTAQRLMANAEAGLILISESTAAMLGGSFDLERLPELKVKGRSEAVPVFSVRWSETPVATATVTRKRRPARGAIQSRSRKTST